MSPRESIRSAGSTTGGAAQDCCGRLGGWLGSDSAAEINEIVGDDPEPHPALHSIVAGISAPVEAMSTLAHADATFAPGAPSLAAVKPALRSCQSRSRRQRRAGAVHVPALSR